jgi:hypothetical protein
MNDASQVVVGANGRVFAGPADTAEPTSSVSVLNAAFTNLGFTSEDGAKFTEGKDIADINAWQSFYPIRKVITGRNVAIAFVLRQWNRDNVEFSLGGTVTDGADPDEYIYEPPDPQELDERALIVEWEDGDKRYRLYVRRGIVTENVETNLMRTSAADLPVTFVATDPGVDENGDPLKVYTLFTNDPAFAAGS